MIGEEREYTLQHADQRLELPFYSVFVGYEV